MISEQSSSHRGEIFYLSIMICFCTLYATQPMFSELAARFTVSILSRSFILSDSDSARDRTAELSHWMFCNNLARSLS